MRDTCEVAVIGAGPYGLSVAAHLKAARISTRVFGEAMGFWRRSMPKGMNLRSPWRASNLADPKKAHALDAYATEKSLTPTDRLPLAEFVRYGEWFQARAVSDLDTRKATRVSSTADGFCLDLEDGDAVVARRVVIAMGLANQAFKPAQFGGIPASLASHSSVPVEFEAFRGRRVAVIGRGQSACESAVLLSEACADVELICRGDVHWIGSEAPGASIRNDVMFGIRDILESKSAVGPFPLNWLVDAPTLLYSLPTTLRTLITVRSLRAAATAWLRPRATAVRINAGRTIAGASAKGDRIALQLDNGTSVFDHAILATGYRINIAKLGVLAPDLLAAIRSSDGYPLLSRGFESSVPGLHFVGATAAKSFGPLPRFVAGAGYAARCVTQSILGGTAVPILRHAPRPAMQS